MAAPSVVDQNVDAAQAFGDRVDQVVPLIRNGYVGWYGQDPPATLFDFPGHPGQPVLRTGRKNCSPSVPGKPPCASFANSGGGAGDKYNSV